MTRPQAKALFSFLKDHSGTLEVQHYPDDDGLKDILVLNEGGESVLSVDRNGNLDVRVVVGEVEVSDVQFSA